MADKPLIEHLRDRLQQAGAISAKPDVPLGMLAMWSSAVRLHLERLYGTDSPLLSAFPARGIDRSVINPRIALAERVDQVHRLIRLLEEVPAATMSPLLGQKIFIGHGRSHVWLQLKDFIREQFRLPCDEFNIEPAAGISTIARLEAMLEQAGFAFAVMTAEEQHADGRTYARPNVIHESGLFQGKLGTRRAIILLEEGCSDFSNIRGLTQIRFPKENLRAVFEDIREVLKRERVI